MKKIILSLVLIGLNLSAYEMCGDKIELGKQFTPSKNWSSKNEKAFGVEYTKYEKFEGFQHCQVFIENATKNVAKLVKTAKTDKPVIPSEKIEGAVFSAGKILSYNSNKKSEEMYSAFAEFKKEFEKSKTGLRFAQAEYKNENLIATNNTMCLSLGNKCSTVLELKSLKMKNSYHSEQKGSLVNEKMNEIVKSQDLKLSETKGWK